MDYIEGIVKYITYYNEENAYAVVKVSVTETNVRRGLFNDLVDSLMTITGYFPRPLKGEAYRFYGSLTYHDKYGEQFSASSYEKVSETNIEGLIEYLSSDLFKGVGEKTAERVVETLGKKAIAMILENPDCLDRVPKLNSQLKKVLYEGLNTHRANEQTLIKLYGYGISSRLAMRIIHSYQDKTMRYLEENPYRMIDEIDGIGFERADFIAKKFGFDEQHPLRIKALLIHYFKALTLQNGHTFLDKSDFIETVIGRLNQDQEPLNPDEVVKAFEVLVEQGDFVLEEDNITLKSIQRAEHEITTKIKRLISKPHDIDSVKVDELILAFEKASSIQYTKAQKKAIIEALKNQIFILTGGPGTGKTTVIQGLVDIYYQYHKLNKPNTDHSSLIHLIAPTGRAAKRIKESTGYYATTIHRLLGYSYDGSYQHNKYHPIDGNLFIIDEASMIDVFLASQLLQSIPDYAHVVIVGDDAQLPSVGPGQVFKDLLDADIIPSISLDVIHRQDEGSSIIELAQAIRQGYLPESLNEQKQDRYIFQEVASQYLPRLKRIIDYHLDLGYDLNEDIQVLIPMYKGDTGIDETNRFIQKHYNTDEGPSIQHAGRTFKVNDKVLQLVNQIEDGIMNGDQGKVVSIDEEASELTVQFIEQVVTYKLKDLSNLNHAYAMSIHKAQGSEYNLVILPIFAQSALMLKRKLIYTAITRAKKSVIILGEIRRLPYAVASVEDSRHTMLKDKLIDSVVPVDKKQQEPLPLKVDHRKRIYDDTMPFDTLGEEMDGLTPYDFLEEE